MILPLPCVIVAGGKSSRMGRDKALLPFGKQKTLTQYQLQRVTPWFENVYISCKSRDKFNFDASFIEDDREFDEFSPLVALYSILKTLQTPVAILSVDTPFVSKEVYDKLYHYISDFDAIIAKSPFGSHQLCAIYSPKILHILKEQIIKNNHKIRNVLTKVKTKYLNFDDDSLFTNINRPDEYNNANEKSWQMF